MDVAHTLNAMRASARSGQVFPKWWCLSDTTEQEQARAYCQAYIPFYRHDTWGISLTSQVVRFTLPQPRSTEATEASCNAIGFALLDQLGMGSTARRTGIGDKEDRIPNYLDLRAVELVVLDEASALLQQGKAEPRLRRREVLWLQQLFHRPAYERPESTGITRILGKKQGLSIPVVVLGDSTLCHLLAQMEVAGTPDRTSLLLPEQVDDYGPPAEAGTLALQDLNQPRAYLRLPRLHRGVQLVAYNTDQVGEPAFGLARWEGRDGYLFRAIEHSAHSDNETEVAHITRYVLLEATAEQIEESSQRQHHLHPGEVRQNAVMGWFQREDALLGERVGC